MVEEFGAGGLVGVDVVEFFGSGFAVDEDGDVLEGLELGDGLVVFDERGCGWKGDGEVGPVGFEGCALTNPAPEKGLFGRENGVGEFFGEGDPERGLGGVFGVGESAKEGEVLAEEGGDFRFGGGFGEELASEEGADVVGEGDGGGDGGILGPGVSFLAGSEKENEDGG